MSSIFGSPPEPLFNEKGCLPLELLEDLYQLQTRRNEEGMHSGSIDDGNFKHGTWSETIFLICKKFQQPSETRYLAVEIFDRFMIKSLKNLHQPEDSTTDSRWRIPISIWNKSSRKCKKRILLYVISCVQLASKMCSHYRILSCRRCCDFLRDSGVFCSRQLVLDAELCVLKTLDYKIQLPCPIVYVETILELMGRKETVKHQLHTLHATSLQILDLVYLKRPVIYSKLYEIVTGDTLGTKCRDKFTCVEKDGILLAASVIASAAFILERTTVHQVIGQLAGITSIPNEDIVDFTLVLVVHCLS